MNRSSDDSLIVGMIAQAALEGDTERALYLHDCWIVEFTPEEKAELQHYLGEDYEVAFESDKVAVQ